MDAGGISVTRALPIDAALAGDVLIRLRRDVAGSVARWTLGGRGTAEVDVDFVAILTADGSPSPAWSSTGRLWDPDGVALLHVVIELWAEAADGCALTLRPAADLTPWWSARIPELRGLAQASLDELCEELLWHATRPGVATHSDL